MAISTIWRRDSGRSRTRISGLTSSQPISASRASARRRCALGIDQAEAPRRRRDRDIVRDREVGHQRQFLEDADDAGRVGGGWRGEADIDSGKAHAAGIGLDHAGDDLDQRRLAGAVLAQHRVDLAALAGEIDALEGAHAAIALGDAGQCEEGRLASGLHPAYRGLRQRRPGGCQAVTETVAAAGYWVFFSLCAMISGAVKFTPQGRNWFGAKKLALSSGQ